MQRALKENEQRIRCCRSQCCVVGSTLQSAPEPLWQLAPLAAGTTFSKLDGYTF